MKKIILTFIITFLAMTNVYAVRGEECSTNEITQGQNDLLNASFELKYADNAIDQNGDFIESQFILTIPNLPSGYEAKIVSPEGTTYIGSNTDYALVTGGVYKIEYYSKNCDTLLKKTEFMAPFYKVYCELEGDCENVWFDGTYENTASNQNKKDDSKLSTRLVIILITLIIIIVLFAAVIYKRRKDYEKSL